jgi:uncharacterized Zn finger protein
MDTTKLTSANLQVDAQNYRDLATVLMNIRGRIQAELQELIDSASSLAEINNKKEEIIGTNSRISQSIQKAQDLDSQALLNLIVNTDSQDAMAKILEANNQVLKAVQEINDIRRVFQYIDLLIRVASGIVNAATTITPPAQIKAIVGAINNLYDGDFS